MTTKEQERKALEQIKKIVAGLGENSYIGTALEGCLEIASENIENDWACSMKQRAESAEKKAEERTATIEHLQCVRKHLEKQVSDLEGTVEANHRDVQNAWGEVRELKAKLEAAEGKATAAAKATLETKITIERQADEIVHLKAKLYDLLTK